MTQDPRSGPPPGEIHELAERAVDFVRRALHVTLDYTPETLPVLDHWLRAVPRDEPAMLELAAATAGAYFGEVVRKTLGGEWRDDGVLRLVVGIELTPAGMAAEAISNDDSDGRGTFEVPAGDRAAVEDALSAREVPEDEYYSLCGRLELLQLVADVLVGRREAAQGGSGFEPEA
jgi:hypothetical protein